MLASDEPKPLRYNREIFEIRSIEEAKRIILTGEDSSTEERWERETPYLVDSIMEFLNPDPTTLLLDYGCGIGRISKELIVRSRCSVLGVDISRSMRQLAPGYVADARFAVCAGASFDEMQTHGLRTDGAIAIWSLQHCPRVEDDIGRIETSLKPGGGLFVCNMFNSAVPTNQGWVDLGFDIRELLAEAFVQVSVHALSPERTSKAIAENSFLGRYRKRP